jgi:AcrR family transcriptional regulator
VPVKEIARRAGVGTGTVSRHFPTKEQLFEAILFTRAAILIENAERLAGSPEPGAAFFEYFSLVVAEGAANRGVAEALAGAGYDLDALAEGGGLDVMGALENLLTRAQLAGAVRGDVDTQDIKALITACLAREQTYAYPATRERIIAVVAQGLRPPG